ncbi:HPF/RaiA family ribosome-associated protein [Accumulibacter sp.]|uniref:HPF/RaiA family ribosome-associated protein n=1 Tax=Accumulibacter sp. TaxID=2053492 RepID=UPI0028C4E8C7|nr:HPF/RaiA family ribosome-associated protein [Accumulibacter sp.]
MQIEIHAHGFPLSEALRAHVERRFQFAVGRFEDRVQGVIVRLSDLNGPRGGVDKHCQVQLRLRGLPKIVIKDTEADTYVAVDRAADRSGRTLGRNLQRAQRKDFVSCWVEWR